MLPEKNYPIVFRIEFVSPTSSPPGEGIEIVLHPDLQGTADKVQQAAQSKGEGVEETVFIHLDPIRLSINPKDLKADPKILEKILSLFPFKLAPVQQQQAAQAQPKKEEKETAETPVPTAKNNTSAKGEALTSDQKTVAEEIEGISRPQGEQVLDRQAISLNPLIPLKNEKLQNPEVIVPLAPKNLPEEAVKKENPPSQHTPEKKEEHPTQNEVEKRIAKEPQMDEKVKPQPQGIQNIGRPVEKGEIPVMVTPFPVVSEVKTEVQPMKVIPPVEKVAKVEGVQPIIRETPFQIERTVDQNAKGGIVPIHKDERDVVRIPMNPDLPLTRENLFKKQFRGSGQLSESDEGHLLGDLIHMLLCAYICGASTPGEAWSFLDQRATQFKKWLNLKQGIPSYRFMGLFLSRLSTASMDELLQAVTGLGPQLHSLQRIILWETDRGLLVAQSGKEAMKCSPLEMLKLFEVKGSILHLDLPLLDPSMTRNIRQKNGNYLYKIRPTHNPLYETLLSGFNQHPNFREVYEGARSSEMREITVQPLEGIENDEKWVDLQGAVKFNSEIFAQAKHWIESRIYLTNLPLNRTLASTLRSLSLPSWIEWSFDCDFTDWSCNNALHHTEKLKQFAWKLLELKGKNPLELRKKAQRDLQFLAQILRVA